MLEGMNQENNMIQRKLWNAELEILNVIHDVCMEQGLRYSLAYGTLIGAVRHKGFIPWDDDIDLIMPRGDYEKLITNWNNVAPKGFVLQNTKTDPDFTQNFTKIRKDHTTFLQIEEEREKKYHKGIFVDIFPGDRVAGTRLGRAVQYAACAVNLLYSRGYSSGSGGVIGKTERFLLKMPLRLQIAVRNAAERCICLWNHHKDAQYVFPSTIADSRLYYPADIFDRMITIEFCGRQYQSVSDPDTVLRLEYGDYMELPPEEERVWKHNPILIDFEHNYEELFFDAGE